MESYKVLLCWFFVAMTALAIEPEAIYNGGFNTTSNSSILLKIGNGGAGQSGLIKGMHFSKKTFTKKLKLTIFSSCGRIC